MRLILIRWVPILLSPDREAVIFTMRFWSTVFGCIRKRVRRICMTERTIFIVLQHTRKQKNFLKIITELSLR